MDDPVNILFVVGLTAEERARVEAIDPRIRVIEGAGWFDGEMRESWPRETGERYIAKGSTGRGTRAERDAMMAAADIAVVTFPFPLDLRARGRRLKWVHQRPAGASNLMAGDLWGSDIPVTTSRGFAASRPIAEYVVAAFLHFAKDLHRVAPEREARTMDRRNYRPVLLGGKTACIVGTGGIGREVGRLSAALGMRVVGTRRDPDGALPEGFSEIRPAGDLHALLAESDFVAICCQWTPETEKLFDARAFAAMKDDAVLVNVARGEIVDEDALIATLATGKLRGAALDVYVGEFEGPPDPRLWDNPRVLITPHSSGGAEVGGGSAWLDIFCRNLEAFLRGEPLANRIDWERGY